MRQVERFFTMLLLLVTILAVWPPAAARAAYLSDPKDLGTLRKGKAITRNDPAKGTETVTFDAYWTIIVDGQTVGEDLTITEPGKTAGNTNYIARSQAQQWVEVFNGSWNYAEDAAPWVTLTANGRTSTRVHIRPLAKVSGAYVEKYDYTQKKVWVLTTPWPSGNIPDLRGVVAGQPQTFWVEAYASTPDVQGLKYKFLVDGTPVIDNGSAPSNYAGFYVSYTFPSAGSYTMRLEVTDMVGRTTPITKTVSVAPAPQPPPAPPAPPPAGQPVADFDLPPFGEVGQNVQVVNRSRASEGFWLVNSEWTVTPRTYTGSLGMAGGTLVFNRPGTYTVKLQVWDNQNNTSTASKSISISENAPPPPPPPPPRPENIPPVARFDMVAQASPGVSVPVKNRSYDLDGEIVAVDWEVSPAASANLADTGGSIVFDEPDTYSVTLTVEDDRGAGDSVTQTIRITNEPPVARISAPDTVFQGDDVEITSLSYDPDGEIASHSWSVAPPGMVGTLAGEGGSVYFDEPGTYAVRLRVEDAFGLSDMAEKSIEVKAAVPTAFFRWTGTPKQNRKMVFDASESYGSERYPVDFGRNRWEFLPPAGVSQEAVKIISSPDLKTRQVLFKEPGDYRVRLVVENTKGTPSPVYEQVVTVYPDDLPVADFYTIRTVSRDPDNHNRAAIALMDRSRSPDGDVITKRVWQYRYDSDNDDSFTDEAWVTLDSGNNPTPTLYTDQVGKYEFSLYVEESFGQETIPEFITPADKRAADTSTKPLAERSVEVINIQPLVNFDVIRQKKVDLMVKVGNLNNYQEKFAAIAGGITGVLLPGLAAQQIDARIVNDDISSGTTYGGSISQSGSNYVIASRVLKATVEPAGYFGVRTVEGFPETTADDNQHLLYRGDVSHTSGVYLRVNGSIYDFWGTSGGTTFVSGNSIRTVKTIAGIEVTQVVTIVNEKFIHFSYQLVNRSGSSANVGLKIYYDTDVAGNDGNPIKSVDGGWEIYSGQVRAKGVVYGDPAVTRPDDWRFETWSGSRKSDWPYDDGRAHYSSGYYNGYVYSSSDTAISMWWHSRPLAAGASKTLSTMLGVDRLIGTRLAAFTASFPDNNWREDEGVERFVVVLTDTPFEDYNDLQARMAFLSATNAASARLVVAGANSFPQSQGDVLVAGAALGGTVLRNDNAATLIDQLAGYISSLLQSRPALIEQYVLLGEEVRYRTYYADPENDPQIQERWLYHHDPAWFRNSLGEAGFNGQFLPAPVTRFDKVGKYDVEFQARDNPKNDDRFDSYRLWSAMPQDNLTLYVHRRPVALYSLQLTPNGNVYNVTVQDQSYDPDHQGEAGNGIRAGEWRWKEAAAAAWNSGLPATLAAGQTYLFSLRVQDVDGPGGVGVWSLPTVRVVSTASLNMPPVAQFTVNPNPLPLGKILTYNDLSYDPNGDAIVQRQWRVKKLPAGTWADYGGTPPVNFTALGLGDYRIELKVRDQRGAWSEPYYQVLTVIPDNNAPVARFTVSPNPLPLDVPVSYSDTSWDPDGDPIVAREWQYQKNGGVWVSGQPLDFSALGAGSYNIRLRVKDQPALSQMTPKWSEWYTQSLTVVAGNQKPVARFTVAPNPALTDEPVTYTDTSYDPEGAGIAERVWQVTDTAGRVLGEYHNQLPPRVFANTGWGDGGVGTYRIGLRVRDNSPNGVSPALWSDWTWQTLTVVMPLSGSGEITPNPALSGFRVRVTVWTSGYAEEVRVKFPDDAFFRGDEIVLTPAGPISGKENTWRGAYLTDAKTPDGPYTVMATIRRRSVAPQTVTVPLTLVIRGDIYDQVRVRIRDSR